MLGAWNGPAVVKHLPTLVAFPVVLSAYAKPTGILPSHPLQIQNTSGISRASLPRSDVRTTMRLKGPSDMRKRMPNNNPYDPFPHSPLSTLNLKTL